MFILHGIKTTIFYIWLCTFLLTSLTILEGFYHWCDASDWPGSLDQSSFCCSLNFESGLSWGQHLTEIKIDKLKGVVIAVIKFEKA